MNGIKYLLDTCFVIQWHAKDKKVFEMMAKLDLQPFWCAYSDITYAEVFGFPTITPQAEYELQGLLMGIERLPVSKQVIDKVVQIRKTHKIKLPDCLILATAKVHDLQLLTLDEKLKRIDKEIG